MVSNNWTHTPTTHHRFSRQVTRLYRRCAKCIRPFKKWNEENNWLKRIGCKNGSLNKTKDGFFLPSLPEMDIKEAQAIYNQHRKKTRRWHMFSSKGNAEDIKTTFVYRVSNKYKQTLLVLGTLNALYQSKLAFNGLILFLQYRINSWMEIRTRETRTKPFSGGELTQNFTSKFIVQLTVSAMIQLSKNPANQGLPIMLNILRKREIFKYVHFFPCCFVRGHLRLVCHSGTAQLYESSDNDNNKLKHLQETFVEIMWKFLTFWSFIQA